MKDVFNTFKYAVKRMSRAITKEEVEDVYHEYRIYLRYMNIGGDRFSSEIHDYLARKIVQAKQYYLQAVNYYSALTKYVK